MGSKLSRILRATQEADRHEIQLQSIRLTTLLTAQSLIITAAALIYNRGEPRPAVVWALCILGLQLSVLTLISMAVGCMMIRRWFRHLSDAWNSDVHKTERDHLDGILLPRQLPDGAHLWGFDIFMYGMSGTFVLFWIVSLIYLAIVPISNAPPPSRSLPVSIKGTIRQGDKYTVELIGQTN